MPHRAAATLVAGARRGRRSALVATGCDTGIHGLGDGSDDGGPAPVTLVVSRRVVADHQGDAGAAARPAAPTSRPGSPPCRTAIDRLRDETHTGWTGRQDDVTGYLAELSRRVVAGRAGRVHGRLRPAAVRRRLRGAPARRPGRADRARHRHDQGHPGRRRRTGPGRVAGLRRARRPGDRRARPGVPGLDRLDHPDRARQDRPGASPSRPPAARRRHPRRWSCCRAAPACWPGWSPWPRRPTAPPRWPAPTTTSTPRTGDILSVQPVSGEGRVALPWAASAAAVPPPGPRRPAVWLRRGRGPARRRGQRRRTRSAARSPATASRPARASS